MQFIPNGPDIPDTLLQELEYGNVIFFCGAGISVPTGLPNFKGLVDRIYQNLDTSRFPLEDVAYNKKQYDSTLELLEQRLQGNDLPARRALHKELKIKKNSFLETHQAILELSKSRSGPTRLITTNYDRGFEEVIKAEKLKLSSFEAPLLPIPKNSRWNGIVYLHGLIKKEPEESSLARLILTSGDFGRAYLTERWASRFVSEVFRNYIVCFIGYSIDDPVLRYMMDALAGDRRMGEKNHKAYAFGGSKPDRKGKITEEWEAKGVTPILYDTSGDACDHRYLHRTLKAWATTYKDGARGKQKIIIENASAQPTPSTNQDDYIGRLIWAISDSSAVPAKHFADHEPTPPLEWLFHFEKLRYNHSSLQLFNVFCAKKDNPDLSFSLIKRPSPYSLSPQMKLVENDSDHAQWDGVMYQIGRWLTRHLNNPNLILWLSSNGAIHSQLQHLIEDHLDRIKKLETQSNKEEIGKLLNLSPDCIPSDEIRPFWNIYLAGRLGRRSKLIDVPRWLEELKTNGATFLSRIQLREIIQPIVLITNVSQRTIQTDTNNAGELKPYLEWTLGLTCDYAHYFLKELTQNESSRETLPKLFPEFENALNDALELTYSISKENSNWRLEEFAFPSISPHPQNESAEDWTVLIELTRDAWIAISQISRTQAEQIARRWFHGPHAIFKRLALFAAAQPNIFIKGEWLDWLDEDTDWFWNTKFQRETFQLLTAKTGTISQTQLRKIEKHILSGPKKERQENFLDDKVSKYLLEQIKWMMLQKMAQSEAKLSQKSIAQLKRLKNKHPEFKTFPDQREEFCFWMGPIEAREETQRPTIPLHTRSSLLARWLLSGDNQTPTYTDGWGKACRTSPLLSAAALIKTYKQGAWLDKRWSQALNAWSDDKLCGRSWNCIAPFLSHLDKEKLRSIALPLSVWMAKAISKSREHAETYLILFEKISSLPSNPGIQSTDLLTQAINHPAGKATLGLLDLIFSNSPNDSATLGKKHSSSLSIALQPSAPNFNHSAIIVASRTVSIFRLDPEWAKQQLIPLFSWENRETAKTLWQGFLWSARLNRSLLEAFKPYFIETAKHYDELERQGSRYISLLTYAMLDSPEAFCRTTMMEIFRQLPHAALKTCLQTLTKATLAAEDKKDAYWKNRTEQFWRSYWPKTVALKLPEITQELARLAIASGSNFPAALKLFDSFLVKLKTPGIVIKSIEDSNIASLFPQQCLQLIDRIIDKTFWPSSTLRTILDQALEADSRIGNDEIYLRLSMILSPTERPERLNV